MPDLHAWVVIYRQQLTDERDDMLRYLARKMTTQDLHAVADAAMDLREIDAKLDVLRQVDVIITDRRADV
jgi:hypothetical protein